MLPGSPCSIAKALVQNMRGANIVGVDPRQETLDLCMKEHIIKFGHKELNILRGCGVIFVCTPIETVSDIIGKIFQIVGNRAIITDVAGVKAQIFANLPRGIRFVSGHPMSGSENTGFENSDGALMENCNYILIREKDTADADFDKVKGIVSAFTNNIVEMDAETHDGTVAATSHLLHVMAYTLAGEVLPNEKAASVIGRGFMDLTRIARSQTPLWVNTCRLNSKAVCKEIEAITEALNSVKTMIENKEWDKLEAHFERGRNLCLAVEKKKDVKE
jgi:prephenate dehydrogenase